LSIVGKVVETGVASTGRLRRIGVDLLKIMEHGFHRGPQAVEIEAIEADLRGARPKRVVVFTKPLDELDHVGVAPHPGWEAPEVGEPFYGIDVVAHAAHIAVDAVSVGPIGLDRHGRKTLLLDQPPGDPGALVVEVVRAVGCLAEQHEARSADQLEQRLVVGGGAG